MTGDSKYLFHAFLFYNVSAILKWKIYKSTSGSIKKSFPIRTSKRKNWSFILYLLCMTDKCYAKDLQRSTGDLLIYISNPPYSIQIVKNNDIDEIFVNALFDRDESTKSYSVHLVSSCVGVSDEIYRTKGTIPEITKSNLDELFLENVIMDIHDYTRVSCAQIFFISKLWI